MCYTIEAVSLPFHDRRLKEECPDQGQDSYASDSESCVSGHVSVSCSPPDLFNGGLDRLDEVEDRFYGVIRQRFLSGLGGKLAPTVVAIYRKNWSGSVTALAKVRAFQIHRRFVESQGHGDANLKFGWFGSSRAGVERIMSHGFGLSEVNQNNGVYGRGVYISPDDSTLESAESAEVDDDGLRHVVLCRVLLGKTEAVHPCSDQTHPSSDEFHSGVDSLESPKKYIVWSTKMNTHILPEYVVSFKVPLPEQVKKPSSPYVPFPALIQELSKLLPSRSVGLISKLHKDYKERRISRTQLIKQARKLAGDEMLMAVIKSWRTKNPRAAF